MELLTTYKEAFSPQYSMIIPRQLVLEREREREKNLQASEKQNQRHGHARHFHWNIFLNEMKITKYEISAINTSLPEFPFISSCREPYMKTYRIRKKKYINKYYKEQNRDVTLDVFTLQPISLEINPHPLTISTTTHLSLSLPDENATAEMKRNPQKLQPRIPQTENPRYKNSLCIHPTATDTLKNQKEKRKKRKWRMTQKSSQHDCVHNTSAQRCFPLLSPSEKVELGGWCFNFNV